MLWQKRGHKYLTLWCHNFWASWHICLYEFKTPRKCPGRADRCWCILPCVAVATFLQLFLEQLHRRTQWAPCVMVRPQEGGNRASMGLIGTKQVHGLWGNTFKENSDFCQSLETQQPEEAGLKVQQKNAQKKRFKQGFAWLVGSQWGNDRTVRGLNQLQQGEADSFKP